MTTRACKKCHQELPVEQFPLAGRKLNLDERGNPYRRYVCGSCYTLQKKAQRHRTTDWFKELRKTLKCENCGIHDFRVIEFHHIDPSTKELNVADMAGHNFGKQRILEEISKCKVLCANCHRIHHYEERLTQKE